LPLTNINNFNYKLHFVNSINTDTHTYSYPIIQSKILCLATTAVFSNSELRISE